MYLSSLLTISIGSSFDYTIFLNKRKRSEFDTVYQFLLSYCHVSQRSPYWLYQSFLILFYLLGSLFIFNLYYGIQAK